MAAGQELTATSYIQHHLSFNAQSVGDGSFWTLYVDTLVTGAIIGIVSTALMWWVVRGATPGVPNRPGTCSTRCDSCRADGPVLHTVAGPARRSAEAFRRLGTAGPRT